MRKQRARMDERILVCVYYGPNGQRLIRRGAKIASMLDCPFYILTIDPLPVGELHAERYDYINKWKQLGEENEVEEFIIKDNEKRPVSKVIAEVAREKQITQIVLGQTAQSRWEQITKGSIINSLLRDIPFIDLHIISIARTIRSQSDTYEKGVRAYLIKKEEGYNLSFVHSPEVVYEGIFFKEIGTDFNNGIFKFMQDNKTTQVYVYEDYVKELKHVDITEC